MWTIRPNSSQLWHIRQNSSHVKNPTEFLTHIFANNATCNLLDRLYQTWVIQWYSAHMWQKSIEFIQDVIIGQNTSHVKNPTEFLTPIFAENIKCKISDIIGQTWGIQSNTSQMWRVWPNSTKLSHIQQNTSHVKNPTEFLTPIFTDNVTCKIFDQLCQTWEIQWYTTRLWKNRPDSYKLWHIGQKTSHVKNATQFLTPIFTENVSPVWRLTKYSTGE